MALPVTGVGKRKGGVCSRQKTGDAFLDTLAFDTSVGLLTGDIA